LSKKLALRRMNVGRRKKGTPLSPAAVVKRLGDQPSDGAAVEVASAGAASLLLPARENVSFEHCNVSRRLLSHTLDPVQAVQECHMH
jgi:hypothetical protein